MDTPQTARQFLDKVGSKLGIQNLQDWYEVGHKSLIHHGATPIYMQYGNSMYSMMLNVYPDEDWQLWRFRYATSAWNEEENQVKCAPYKHFIHFATIFTFYLFQKLMFIEWLSSNLQISHAEQWYFVKNSDIYALGGTPLLKKYQHRIFDAFMRLYPEYIWQPSQQLTISKRFFQDHLSRRRYFDWAASKLAINQPHDWTTVTCKDVHQLLHGKEMMDYYGDSILEALQDVYPDHVWQPWKFGGCPQHYWDDPENQVDYLLWLAQELNLAAPEHWYNVQSNLVRQRFGGSLLNRFSHVVVFAMLNAVFPEYVWHPWLFAFKPTGYWESVVNHREFLNWIAVQNEIEHWEQWYNLKSLEIAKMGGKGIVDRYDTMYDMMEAAYPEYPWVPWRFAESLGNSPLP
jgi:hypothetical protein